MPRNKKQNNKNDILYGRQPVHEMLKAGKREVLKIYLSERMRPSSEINEIIQLAEEKGCKLNHIDPRQIDYLFEYKVNHQGVAASVSGYPYSDFDIMFDKAIKGDGGAFLLVLDHINDPQNLGAILRTAEAAGVHGVIIPKDRATSVTPAAVRASAGASEHIPVAMVTNIVNSIRMFREEEIKIVGLEGLPAAISYAEADLHGPIALVIGSEGKGISRLAREHCDTLIKLPLKGKVSSLNASAAGAIALYEICRQRLKN